MCAFSFRPQLAPAPAGAFVISDYTDKDVSPPRAADHDRLCDVTLIHAPTRYTAYRAIIPISVSRASGRSADKGIDGAPRIRLWTEVRVGFLPSLSHSLFLGPMTFVTARAAWRPNAAPAHPRNRYTQAFARRCPRQSRAAGSGGRA
jgi:hypothetical protein